MTRLTFYLAFLLTLTNLHAQTEIPLSNLTYTNNGSSITITECDPSTAGDVSIPSTIEGLPVTQLGNYAFLGCMNITHLSIPDGVTKIGSFCFFNCWGIEDFDIPDSVTTIERQAFRTCLSITSFTFPPKVKNVSSFIFLGCSSLETITLHSGITSLNNNAFDACYSLQSISIPGSVKIIPRGCFDECSALQTITFEEGVETINATAFTGCSALTTLNLPASLTNVDTSLQEVPSLSTITLAVGNTNYQVADGALYDITLTQLIDLPRGRDSSYVMPNTVTSLLSGAMQNCTQLPSLTIGSGLLSLDGTELNGCTNLTQILTTAGHTTMIGTGDTVTNITGTTLQFLARGYTGGYVVPDTITDIAENALNQCDLVTSFTVNHQLTSIGTNAVSNCALLGSVILTESIDTLGTGCFQSNPSLQSIQLPTDLVSLPNSAFSNCITLEEITLPSSVTSLGESTFSNCVLLGSINLSAITTYGDNALTNCSSLTNLQFSTNQITLGANTFKNCDSITTLNVPNVTSIPAGCFSHMDSLTSVTFPDTLESIGNKSFASCTALTSINFGKGLKTIGSESLSYCGFTTLTLPEGIESIDDFALGENYFLRHVELPASLSSMETETLYECPELVSVLFRGDAPALNGSDNFVDCHPDLTIYYFTGASGFGASYDTISTLEINLSTTPLAVWSLEQGLNHDQDLETSIHLGTGAAYLVLYALDLNADTATPADLPQTLLTGDEWQLSYTPARNDITYLIEYSTDLDEWLTDNVSYSSGDDITTAHVPAITAQCFVRMRVTYSPSN